MTPSAITNGTALLLEGKIVEASQVLAEALARGESAELWNDWAVAQLRLAESGFRRALQRDPACSAAVGNLGLLLFSIGDRAAASPFLRDALAQASGPALNHLQTLIGLCESAPPAPGIPATDTDTIRRHVYTVLEDYFVRHKRETADLHPPDPARDPQPFWIEQALERGPIHDEDYIVFGAFQDPATTILDIGAHFGYSVVSIWGSGALASVVSFEANRRFASCLSRIADLRSGRYDYRMMALSDHAGTLEFAVPVLNGETLGALATTSPSPDLSCLTENIVDHFKKYRREDTLQSFVIQPFEAPVARLDDLLAAEKFAVPLDKIVAMKIDTEGHEAQILAGCPRLLSRQHPLILAEGGHSNPVACRQLLDLGYLYAGRVGKQLEVVRDPLNLTNGFFLHPEHFARYRELGLLLG